jgi:beta-lysine 5,6-aminomutase alpha subunit
MRHLSDEVSFKDGGIIQTRAAEVLGEASGLLEEIEELGLFATLEKGVFFFF